MESRWELEVSFEVVGREGSRGVTVGPRFDFLEDGRLINSLDGVFLEDAIGV